MAKKQAAAVKQPTDLVAVPCVVLTVDKLLELIERVAKMEARLSNAEAEAQNNFDCLIDYVPRVQKDGSIVGRCFTDDDHVDVILKEAPQPQL